ncbi:aldose 1-epimerase family protein [Pedobacter sp. SYP-B3415]|uniref:aldose 1-epimerase family protein n=1 Tax=Pedobacter sp. SYP-B3415 TaxID=2496641 RepID=UPI00101C4E8F|nr:aldose 1-epimerase family protein [Pedobacter sp. SYP-B3415]
MIQIQNDRLSASFAEKGAELQRLTGKTNAYEYLWSGNPAFWGKHSPVLFPVVGALKNDTYSFEGRSYQLSRHGFARDMDFDTKVINDTEVCFTLSDTEATHEKYPFRFSLSIRYRLDGPTLHCSYEVENPDPQRDLLFSAGAHPAFAVPVSENLAYTDYYLTFDNDSNLQYHKIKDNLISDEVKQLTLDSGRLPLSHELFYEDALVFKTLKSKEITLENTGNATGIRFGFDSFPYFGIWSAPDADFVCLEPWCGVADGVNHNGRLEDKEGIVRLGPLEGWNRTWSVTCF